MDKSLSALTAFHITGERLAGELDDVGRLDLRPALFGAYRDLNKLRHDFPLVLVNGDAGGGFVRSLSGVVDEILSDIAPRGIAGERLRQHVLKLEAEARGLACGGGEARSLGEIWDDAGRELSAKTDAAARGPLEESLARAREGLRFDGETVACDRDLPVKFVTHAWTINQRQRAQRLRDKLDDLTLTLSNSLHTDVDNVEQAQGAEKLKRSMGKALEGEFDFDAMSSLLRTAPTGETLPEARRKRLNAVLAVFKSQRFLAPPQSTGKRGRRKEPYELVFDSCEEVLEAIQKRRPEMAKLVKAVAIAELEVANRYDESKHDQFFGHFSHHHLHVEDFALFPPYLVRLHGDSAIAAERTALWQVLSSGLPIKVLVQYDDVLGGDMLGPERLTANIKGPQLAAMALGLGNVFVVQTSSAYLFRLRDSIGKGLASDGPALFSLFSGAPPGNAAASNNSPNVAPYLKAAAATESRAFPGYVYDPEAGSDWASRFHLETNSQPDADWPMRDFHYEDAGLQRSATETAFTFIDFAACDRRYANRFARVPQSSWHDGMIPVKEFLDLDAESAASKVRCAGRSSRTHWSARRGNAAICGTACRSSPASTIRTPRRCSPANAKSGRRRRSRSSRRCAASSKRRPRPSPRRRPPHRLRQLPARQRPRRPARRRSRRPNRRSRMTSPSKSPISRRRAARPATNAPSSMPGCSPITKKCRPISSTPMPAATARWWRRRKPVRSPSSIPASRETLPRRG